MATTASSLFSKGNLSQTQKFMRKVWFYALDRPLCIPRDNSVINQHDDDPYGGNMKNCDIFDVDQSSPFAWNGGYQTFQIAVNKLSLNFIKDKIPTNAREIIVTLDNEIKPKQKSLSKIDYLYMIYEPLMANLFSKLCIFRTIYIPTKNQTTAMLLSDTYFNVDASDNPTFHTVNVHIQSIEDVQTIEFGYYERDYKTRMLENINDKIESFSLELIICNEAWKMYYEAKKYFDEVHLDD